MTKKIIHGGARPGSGRKSKPDAEKKVTVAFQIRKKNVEKAKALIQPILDKLNK